MNLEARTAIEALRAGVPNSAAVHLMGAGDTGLENAFRALLDAAGRRRTASAWPAVSAPASRTR